MTKKDIVDDLKEYLIEKPFSITVWGNIESLMDNLKS